MYLWQPCTANSGVQRMWRAQKQVGLHDSSSVFWSSSHKLVSHHTLCVQNNHRMLCTNIGLCGYVPVGLPITNTTCSGSTLLGSACPSTAPTGMFLCSGMYMCFLHSATYALCRNALFWIMSCRLTELGIKPHWTVCVWHKYICTHGGILSLFWKLAFWHCMVCAVACWVLCWIPL